MSLGKSAILAACVFGVGVYLLKRGGGRASNVGVGVPKVIKGKTAYFMQNIVDTQGQRLDLYETAGGQILDQYGRQWT